MKKSQLYRMVEEILVDIVLSRYHDKIVEKTVKETMRYLLNEGGNKSLSDKRKALDNISDDDHSKFDYDNMLELPDMGDAELSSKTENERKLNTARKLMKDNVSNDPQELDLIASALEKIRK